MMSFVFRPSMRWMVFPLLVCAACDSAYETASVTGPLAELPSSAYLYTIERPRLDAAAAAARAALLGVHGPVVEEDAAFRIHAAGKAVFINKTTGGIRLVDSTTQANSTYATTLTEGEAITLAERYLRERSLLPAGAIPLEAEAITRDDDDQLIHHWIVRYRFELAAVPSGGVGVLQGAVIAVEVGQDEVIGLTWDYPTLRIADQLRLYTPEDTALLVEELGITASEIRLAELTYWYTPFGAQPTMEGQFLVPKFTVQVDDEHGSIGVTAASESIPRVSLAEQVGVAQPVGRPVRLVAAMRGGTAPFSYQWIVSHRTRLPDTVIGTRDVLDTSIPDTARSLTLIAVDARGIKATHEIPIDMPKPAENDVPQIALPFDLWDFSLNPLPVLTGIHTPWKISIDWLTPEGLRLRNLQVNGARVGRSWSLLDYSIDTPRGWVSGCTLGPSSNGTGTTSCNAEFVGWQCWNGWVTDSQGTYPCNNIPSTVPLPWHNPAGGISTQPYFNRSFNDNSLVLSAHWKVTGIGAPEATCSLHIVQTYIFDPLIQKWQACGSADGDLCARFYPIIQYWYVDENSDSYCSSSDTQSNIDGNEITQITFRQRFDYDLSAKAPYGDISGFVNDGDVVAGYFHTTHSDYEEEHPMAQFQPLPDHQYANIDDDLVANRMDNIHQRRGPGRIVVPGCYAIGDQGDMRCVHMHWAWTGLNSIVANDTFGAGTAKVPASQSVSVAQALMKRAESYPIGLRPWDNGEPFYKPCPNIPYKDCGSNQVTFVTTTSHGDGNVNGVGWVNGARKYDQLNFNDWFIE